MIPARNGTAVKNLRESTSSVFLQVDRENMSPQLPDKEDHHGSADTRAKRAYLGLELKRLSPKTVLEWLESKSRSSDRASSEQMGALGCVLVLVLTAIDDIRVLFSSDDDKDSTHTRD